ncbi:kinesin motor domain-containing protein [Cunninghamella echinulata]|nr:kinesin motor domain-containing protein [Cunninghamella echinulata]
MDGYNATVFAYGQTSSGKTYTMMGTETEPGVIPRAVNEVFEYIKMAMNNEFLLRVSYLEIYNETIRDLLAPENDQLKIHEDRHRGIYVTPLTEEVVTCPQDVMNVIRKGEGNRHISTTDYNLHSSRSHTIFQMVIESRERSSNSTTLSRSTLYQPQRSTTLLHNKLWKESVKISQLNLIDLAGSEKAATNQDRRKEGAYINKSLLTLGTVISKLTESGKSAGHIPYRDSKLTRILQSSLSGQAKVVVICTISPYVLAIEESINTLKFATRVKKVVINAKNEPILDDKALLQQYRGEIVDLKSKLQAANDVLLQEQQNSQSMLTAERQQYEQELFQMKLVRTALKDR